GLLYAVHFAFLPQVVRDTFFHRVLPLVAQGYSAYNAPPAEMVNRAIITALIVSLVGLGVPPLRRGAIGQLAGALAAFTLGSVAAYFLQQKGWFYHQIPALGAALLLLAVLTGQLPERLAGPLGRTRWTPALFLLALIVGSGWLIVVEGTAKEEMEGDALGRLF